jgi:hypothetical protein
VDLRSFLRKGRGKMSHYSAVNPIDRMVDKLLASLYATWSRFSFNPKVSEVLLNPKEK